jgi:hypothetical protein
LRLPTAERAFAAASREKPYSKVDAPDTIFLKDFGEDFVNKLSTFSGFLHCGAELGAHRERAAPQKSLLQLDFPKLEFPLRSLPHRAKLFLCLFITNFWPVILDLRTASSGF